MFVRIYTAPANTPIEPKLVRTHGGNMAWFEVGTDHHANTLKNLSQARNAKGDLSYVIFSSCDDPAWNINSVIDSLTGSSFPPGIYQF